MINLFGFNRRPFHLFILPVVFVVNRFFSIVPPDDLSGTSSISIWVFNFLIEVGLALMVGLCLLFFFRFLIKDSIKASLLSTITLVPILFFQDMKFNVEALLHHEVRVRWILLGVLLYLTSLYSLILFSKHSFRGFYEYLNLTFVSLLFYSSVILIVNFDKLNPKRVSDFSMKTEFLLKKPVDVYFIILDAYASNKSLRAFFNYDNSDFSTQLEELGFGVLDDSKSNYKRTIYSLSSTLNLNLLQGDHKYNHSDALRLIKHNIITKSFSEHGYEIKNYSFFDLDQAPQFYSTNFFSRLENEYLDKFYQNSIFKWIAEFFLSSKSKVFFEGNSYRILSDIIAGLMRDSQTSTINPRFFYAHFLAPHGPYVLDSLGNAISPDLQRGDEDFSAYLSQLKGLNKLIIQAVKGILKNSNGSSIIIIQGDHGSRIVSDVNEYKSVFQAYYIPRNSNIDSAFLYNSMSHNIFRLFIKREEKNN